MNLGTTESAECARRRVPSAARLSGRFSLHQFVDGRRSAWIDYGPFGQLGLRIVSFHSRFLFVWHVRACDKVVDTTRTTRTTRTRKTNKS